MQKEAIVYGGVPRAAWRMLCDEGPYLNGTDLAPFPLGFFAAGQMFSVLSAIVSAANARAVPLRALSVEQDNRYTMKGSFLRGDAVGGALAPELTARLEVDTAQPMAAELVRDALTAAPSLEVLRGVVWSVFALRHNGVMVPLDVDTGNLETALDAPPFEHHVPNRERYLPDIITRTAAAQTVHGVVGGACSSLHAVQNRTLHIHSEARWVAGRLLQGDVTLVQPIGSRFRFHCDEPPNCGGLGIAPDPLDYLAAGIGFCFMTQLGRYAHIKKHRLRSYSITQDVDFGPARRVVTRVGLEAEETDEVATDIVRTGQRTCFLHAALRTPLQPTVRVEVNGAALQ